MLLWWNRQTQGT